MQLCNGVVSIVYVGASTERVVMEHRLLENELSVTAAIKHHSAMVYRLALAYTGQAADADDVMQDVFMRLIETQPIFKNEEHAKAWLIRVTINRCKSLLGSFWRRNGEELSDETAATSQPEYDDSILIAMDSLSHAQRLCVHLFYYEDYTIDDIASVTSMNPSTVKSHLHRARLVLAQRLKEDDDEF